MMPTTAPPAPFPARPPSARRPLLGVGRRLALLLLVVVAVASAAPAAPDLSAYPLGATIVPPADGGGVVFKVWAPNATTAAVRGQFNGWSATNGAMTKDAGTGVWSTWDASATAGQQYKFWFQNPGNSDNWRVDPYARDTIHTTDNGIITDRGAGYAWTASEWETPDLRDAVIYELHVGTFSGNGDGVTSYPARFRDVVDAHLDDLKALGVNMVKVMPVKEFPGGVSWGYNPVHFFAPESDYGSPDDLRYMVDRLQANGIGVIIDVVYNHTSTTDNNLWNFDGPANIYFFGDNCQGETPWGSTRPKYTEAMVRKFLVDNVRFWFEEYRVDGLRFDATRFMRGYCNDAGEGWALLQEMTEAARSVNPRALLIAEDLPNDAWITYPVAQGGAGFGAQWDDPYHDTMRAQMPHLGGGGAPDLARLRDAIFYTGWGDPDTSRTVKFSESHDEAAANNGGSRLTYAIDPANPFSEKARSLSMIATGLPFVSPGVPMILQGQEFFEDKPFGDGAGDRIWWGFLGPYGAIRDFYARLITLRRTRPSLRADAAVQQIHYNAGAGVLVFQRYDQAGDVTLVAVNFGTTTFASYRFGFPQAGRWHELANSQAPRWLGTDQANGWADATGAQPYDGMPASAEVRLPGRSLLVFSRTPLEDAGAAHGVMLR